MSIHNPLGFNWHPFEGAGMTNSIGAFKGTASFFNENLSIHGFMVLSLDSINKHDTQKISSRSSKLKFLLNVQLQGGPRADRYKWRDMGPL